MRLYSILRAVGIRRYKDIFQRIRDLNIEYYGFDNLIQWKRIPQNFLLREKINIFFILGSN